ncbi:MAG: glycosyltransferase family 2 protein [Betaproteobacteria bacterium]|nr:glycosyltransferase family 2 protein [Betaproteobacteria bacterium]MDE2623052.1 glycosyltransferase family 2 protein [Betaproteobacteria bacterium]
MKLLDHLRLIPVSIEVPTPYPVCNPSVLATEKGWLALVRALDPVPYAAPGLPYLSSENWLIRYGADFQPVSKVRLNDDAVREICPETVNGLEDGRLFEWSGQLWALFSGLKRQGKAFLNTMLLARIEGDRLTDPVVIPSPKHQSREKNWMPWVRDGELLLVYSTQPMEIYRFDGSRLHLVHRGEKAFKGVKGLMSGSSQVIPWGEDFLAVTHHRSFAPLATRLVKKYVTHDPDYQRKKVRFSHYLLLMDRNFNVKGESPAFHFETQGIEFCAGLACRDGRVLISYGVMDEKAHILELEPASIDRMLNQPTHPRHFDRIAPRVSEHSKPTSVDLVVLNYRNFKTTAARCLDSLWPQVRDIASTVRMQLLDNGSPDGSPSDIREYARHHPGLEHECLAQNLGFAGGMNHAATTGHGEWLLLVNNDTVFAPGSLRHLLHALASAPSDVAAIGPVTNAAGNEQDYFLEGDANEILQAASLFSRQPVNRLFPVYRLDFFCVAIRRKVWEQLGGLDPAYGLGYYEDFDFSVRARQAGYRLMMCEDAFVYHQGGTSFKQSSTSKRLIRTNRDLFTARYPDVLLPHKRDGNLATLKLFEEMIQAGEGFTAFSERIALRKNALERSLPKSFNKRRRWKKAQAALLI